MAQRRALDEWEGRVARRVPVRPLTDHTVQFVWHCGSGDGIISGSDVIQLFAEVFSKTGRGIGWAGASENGAMMRRVWVGGPTGPRSAFSDEPVAGEQGLRGAPNSPQGPSLVVTLDGEAGTHPNALHAAELGWQRLAPDLAHVAGGERLVALGVLAWMYEQDATVVRRLLENQLAPRGVGAVRAALRLFELGWHLAPDCAPYRYETPAFRNHCTVESPANVSRRVGPPDGKEPLLQATMRTHPRPQAGPIEPAGRADTSPMNCRAHAPSVMSEGGGLPELDARTGATPSLAARRAVERLFAALGLSEAAPEQRI